MKHLFEEDESASDTWQLLFDYLEIRNYGGQEVECGSVVLGLSIIVSAWLRLARFTSARPSSVLIGSNRRLALAQSAWLGLAGRPNCHHPHQRKFQIPETISRQHLPKRPDAKCALWYSSTKVHTFWEIMEAQNRKVLNYHGGAKLLYMRIRSGGYCGRLHSARLSSPKNGPILFALCPPFGRDLLPPQLGSAWSSSGCPRICASGI